MTRPHDRDPLVEAEYIRRLALGILSTLEHKGLISTAEVNAILRAAQQAAVSSGPAPAPGGVPQAPAILGTKWVKPGQPYQPIDESTPILPPKLVVPANLQTQGVAQQDEAEASTVPSRTKGDETPAAPVPILDIKMD